MSIDFVVDVAGDPKREGYGNYSRTSENVSSVTVAGDPKREGYGNLLVLELVAGKLRCR